ncbi:MAG: 4Fe-4S binding protein [Dehalococcoidia bacterium]|nr:4Fe-4S binding protein [Dehalococcoidia bacterium]MCA9843547.1 4Fe-4S binding protein [Dehalococcoidia bacterium]MCA9853808.1 4Fe-4S binding protein [Dehalococcoidia bacterium]
MAYSIVETCIGCTACTKRCPTNAITGERNELHVIDATLCIDCGACGVVCPPEAILDENGDFSIGLKKQDWPKAVVIEDKCIGSGCELCINICPFDALSLQHTDRIDDFFGVSTLDPRKCTGCRLCEDVCGWDAIHIFPLRPEFKKPVEALTDQEKSLMQMVKETVAVPPGTRVS